MILRCRVVLAQTLTILPNGAKAAASLSTNVLVVI
jgi:hypothetical protein